MKKESVLELKQQILEPLMKESQRYAAINQSLVAPRVEGRLAVGYSRRDDGEYQLELRVQSLKGKAFKEAEKYKALAKDEANIEETPLIEIPPQAAIQELSSKKQELMGMAKHKRPLHIGLSVSHGSGVAGTLGAFVEDSNGDQCILSNNHVLALMGKADLEDRIFQPGRPDQSPPLAIHMIARLSDFAEIAKAVRNPVDSAIARLIGGLEDNHTSNRIPQGFGFPFENELIRESGKPLSELVKKDDVVCKIGRTTGYTEGRIGAIALDNVPVRAGNTNMLFDNVIQVNWESNKKPFTQPGDSGSLVFTKEGLWAVGLHFAGGFRRIDGKDLGVSYSCDIAEVLKAHEATLLD